MNWERSRSEGVSRKTVPGCLARDSFHAGEAAVRRLARVRLTSRFMPTWAAQGSNYSFKFKGTTDEHLFEGRQVSDGGEQCWVLGVVWCRMSLVVESHR